MLIMNGLNQINCDLVSAVTSLLNTLNSSLVAFDHNKLKEVCGEVEEIINGLNRSKLSFELERIVQNLFDKAARKEEYLDGFVDLLLATQEKHGKEILGCLANDFLLQFIKFPTSLETYWSTIDDVKHVKSEVKSLCDYSFAKYESLKTILLQLKKELQTMREEMQMNISFFTKLRALMKTNVSIAETSTISKPMLDILKTPIPSPKDTAS